VIGAGQTLYYDPSGGSIQLINETGNQDACEDATVTLGFTSS
jgi:outer membrane receptor for monomeric catechols